MSTTAGQVKTADTFAYYIPATTAGQAALLVEHPELSVWVDAVKAAKGRTSDNLGANYPKISEQVYTAIQNALSGAMTPTEALKEAQTAAAAAVAK
jgi:multiple sugar transport system substrate-binding protein